MSAIPKHHAGEDSKPFSRPDGIAGHRWVRLMYPQFEKDTMGVKHFGASAPMRYAAVTRFFQMAKSGEALLDAGEALQSFDRFYQAKLNKEIVGRKINTRFQFDVAVRTSEKEGSEMIYLCGMDLPAFLLGKKKDLDGFQKDISFLYRELQQDAPLLLSGLQQVRMTEYANARFESLYETKNPMRRAPSPKSIWSQVVQSPANDPVTDTQDKGQRKMMDDIVYPRALDAFLLAVEQQKEHQTVGWYDADSEVFVMRSMSGLNRVRELFGMRPHVAMRAQNKNYTGSIPSSISLA